MRRWAMLVGIGLASAALADDPPQLREGDPGFVGPPVLAQPASVTRLTPRAPAWVDPESPAVVSPSATPATTIVGAAADGPRQSQTNVIVVPPSAVAGTSVDPADVLERLGVGSTIYRDSVAGTHDSSAPIIVGGPAYSYGYVDPLRYPAVSSYDLYDRRVYASKPLYRYGDDRWYLTRDRCTSSSPYAYSYSYGYGSHAYMHAHPHRSAVLHFDRVSRSSHPKYSPYVPHAKPGYRSGYAERRDDSGHRYAGHANRYSGHGHRYSGPAHRYGSSTDSHAGKAVNGRFAGSDNRHSDTGPPSSSRSTSTGARPRR